MFLRAIGLVTKVAIPLTIVIGFSPSVVWWSNSIAGILGRIAIGSALILFSMKKTKTTQFLLSLFGSYVITGAFLDYAPWVIVCLFFFLCVGLVEFFGSNKKPLLTVGGAVFGLLPLILFVFAKAKIFSTLAQTTYPGSRRYDGGSINVFNWAFSGPQQWALLNPEAILASNQSELSLGFLIFLIPSIVALSEMFRSKENRFKAIVLSQVYFFLLAWTFVPIPKIGINPLELVSPERALTVTTTLAPLFFGILLAWSNDEVNFAKKQKLKLDRGQIPVGVILATTLSFYITYSAGMAIRSSVAPFPLLISFLIALLVSVAIGMIIARKKFLNFGIWVFACISFFVGVPVNPVVHGFSNIYSDHLSRVLASTDSQKTWASNSMFIDAMLTLNGKNQISGQQLNGPSTEKWRILDPTEKFKDVWNSGASYVQVSFDQSRNPPIVTRIGGDQILISLNPCSEYAKKLDLGFVISTGQLSNSCLRNTALSQPNYLGNTLWVYQIEQ
jgi:hypothetical protein